MYHSNSSKNVPLFSVHSCVRATPSPLKASPILGIDCIDEIEGIPVSASIAREGIAARTPPKGAAE
jgi:hypothetical protein